MKLDSINQTESSGTIEDHHFGPCPSLRIFPSLHCSIPGRKFNSFHIQSSHLIDKIARMDKESKIHFHQTSSASSCYCSEYFMQAFLNPFAYG